MTQMMAIEDGVSRILEKVPVVGGKLAASKNRLASFTDQFFQGIANLTLGALLARALAPGEFGSIGLMLGAYYFMSGLHRANVTLPFIIDTAEAEARGEETRNAWWVLNLLSIALIALTLAVLSAIFLAIVQWRPEIAWVAKGLLYATFTTPALLMGEFGRRWLYQARMAVTAAVSSLAYLAASLGIGALAFVEASPILGVAAWVVAGVCASLVAFVTLRPRNVGLEVAVAAWGRHSRFSLWQSLTHLPYSIYNTSVVMLIGAFSGPLAAAAFTATRTLTNPALSMVSAVDALDKPRAARALASGGTQALRKSIDRTRLALLALTGGYLGVVILAAGPFLHLAFGNAYAGQEMAVRILALGFFLVCMNQPSETLLIVLRAGGVMFITRILAAIMAVAAIWWGSLHYGLIGCATALTLTQLFNLINLRVAEFVALRRWGAANALT